MLIQFSFITKYMIMYEKAKNIGQISKTDNNWKFNIMYRFPITGKVSIS